MFFGNSIKKGPHTVKMTISLPKGGVLVKSSNERYDTKNTSTWLKNVLSQDHSPIDLSFLNHKPAGRHGFITTKEDRLIFEDGTPERFWGGNIAAYALFVDKKSIAAQATFRGI